MESEAMMTSPWATESFRGLSRTRNPNFAYSTIPMRIISGSILVLAAAVLLQPAIAEKHHFDEAIIFAIPVLLVGVALMISGLKKGE